MNSANIKTGQKYVKEKKIHLEFMAKRSKKRQDETLEKYRKLFGDTHMEMPCYFAPLTPSQKMVRCCNFLGKNIFLVDTLMSYHSKAKVQTGELILEFQKSEGLGEFSSHFLHVYVCRFYTLLSPTKNLVHMQNILE